MKELAFTLMQPANLIALVVAILAFLAVLTLLRSSLSGEQLDKRMKAVAQRREELRRQSRQSMVQASNSGLRQTDESLYKRIVDRLNLKTLLEDPKVVDKLAMAGFRGPKPITTFYFFRFLMPFVMGALSTFYIYVVNDFGQPPNIKILICVAMFVAGYYAPNIYISNAASKRRASIVTAFPDALDLLLICVEAGMSIEAALQKVSQEIGSASIELAEELSLLVAELSYLPERRMAYEGLARRTNYPGIKSVCTAMIQAEKYGTPLGTALRVMAKENRELRLSAAEKKAAALPAQLTVPMIVFFLPVLFVVILGPAILNIMDMMGKK
ncbi:type II secretion system F family protein [Asticcacaulis excentricus]|uniref:Type II secretion system F domain protein n=1 Tax=Asticcacaulis excentricus (strain ATCC 15261 / DSM 4724 / KCTC 12464 / NCIMB 9791 / VKM B-1370 / CB 48) TaxID=573065 RepID=E8RQ56_ASTEC|nr:type II secretion system F family protein [Asticcacaulis excentricus]ADU12113.1 Type II secretion system F domain protein [Asticcacaulis excentricus CB 48]